MKDHQSHDVLLMCVRCHQLSNLHDATLRASLAVQCSAPIGTENDVKLRDNFDLKKVKSAGRALLNAKHKLPDSRREQLLQVFYFHGFLFMSVSLNMHSIVFLVEDWSQFAPLRFFSYYSHSQYNWMIYFPGAKRPLWNRRGHRRCHKGCQWVQFPWNEFRLHTSQ